MNNRRIPSLVMCVSLCMVALAALLVLVGDPARAQTTTRYVASTGTDSSNCSNPSNPCATVQYAVDQAASNDVIKVASGVYTGVQGRPTPLGYFNPPVSGIITQVVYISETVTIRGGYTPPGFADPPNPEANPTILDAQEQGRVLLIGGNITPTIEGLRITGGDAAGLGGARLYIGGGDAGGGVYSVDARTTVSNSQVLSNTAGSGGGLFLTYSDATLTGNTISYNTATIESYGGGGGLFLDESDATLSSNHVLSNSAREGGGLFLTYSSATLRSNTVISNTAGGGAGLSIYRSAPTLISNTVSSNIANDPYGSGGGLGLKESDATLIGNTISANTAPDGGGLYLGQSDATLIENTVIANTGGGLTLYRCAPTLIGNTIISNTGGGLDLNHSDATIIGNTVISNTAYSGGGLSLLYGAPTLSRNTISSNSAEQEGGGLSLRGSPATLVGNIITDNSTDGNGGGLFLYNSDATGLHNTIARNKGGDGSGVHVASGTVAWTNTVLVSHTVGVIAAGGMVTLESTLWHGNGIDWGGLGTINHVNDYTGQPAFVDPDAGDYHIGPGSEALNKGVDAGVMRDIDNEPRFGIPDLGADEYWAPGALKYICLPLVLRNAP